MEIVTLPVPMMYGDHHVVEVRKLISALPGITDIYASSCFQVVEVQYDAQAVTADEIKNSLELAGYLGDVSLPVEIGSTFNEENGQEPFFRQTAVHKQTRDSIGFAQKAPYAGRPLWPCPDIGTLKNK